VRIAVVNRLVLAHVEGLCCPVMIRDKFTMLKQLMSSACNSKHQTNAKPHCAAVRIDEKVRSVEVSRLDSLTYYGKIFTSHDIINKTSPHFLIEM
jgi:hypothetical protein